MEMARGPSRAPATAPCSLALTRGPPHAPATALHTASAPAPGRGQSLPSTVNSSWSLTEVPAPASLRTEHAEVHSVGTVTLHCQIQDVQGHHPTARPELPAPGQNMTTARSLTPPSPPPASPSPVKVGALLPLGSVVATLSAGFPEAGATSTLFSWPQGTLGKSLLRTFSTNTTSEKEKKELFTEVHLNCKWILPKIKTKPDITTREKRECA